MRAALIAATAVLMLGGCVTNPTGYEWGTYDKSLSEFYRNSDTQDALITELERLNGVLGSDEFGYDPAALTSGTDGKADRHAVRNAVLSMRQDSGGGEGKARIAPGIHAELGYLKLEEGDTEAAIRQFEREKRAWPEAAGFMDTLIAWVKGDAHTDRLAGEHPK